MRFSEDVVDILKVIFKKPLTKSSQRLYTEDEIQAENP
jgi:hypothetical protein